MNPNYEVIEDRRIEDLKSDGTLLRHKKSGALVTLLKNNDDNKVFYIGFRTTPHDSTGVAHIMEHTVLCGSRKYPVKDPFVELAKSSLNTFLNAMTYPDKTVYPVASCNDKDFKNLMDVYLDAVFYPNIYKEKKIFMQEGWHYELFDGSPLTYNGVVYNEMKGAFSSPDDVLARNILNTLYPDNTYAYESGGAPNDIPDLTYEDYLDFHRTFYHPSNSYIYLYGDMDMDERLDYLDKEYLSKFDKIEVDSKIHKQAAFDKPVDIVEEYPITSEESEDNNTYLSYNVVIGDVLDPLKYIAFQILDEAICASPGSPIKKALLDAGIGTEILSSYDNGVYQPYYSISAKNAELSQKDDFIRIIEDELKKLVKEGIDKTALKASLNQFEFRYREADFGLYPKGLMYGLNILDSWIYDESKPFIHIERNETYKKIRENIETGYFEKLIEDYILNNTHKSFVTVVPKKGLQNERDKALEKKLADILASMSEDDKKTLIKETQELKEYQESEEDPAAIATLPRLTRDDIKKEIKPFINEVTEEDGIKYIFHDINTNGVSYVRMLFKIDCIDENDLFTFACMAGVMGLMDTEEHDYYSFFNEINLNTGGVTSSHTSYTSNDDNSKVDVYFTVKGKNFFDGEKVMFDLFKELTLSTRYEDKKRLLEVLKEKKSSMEADLVSAGHTTAELIVASQFLKSAYIDENTSGLAFYRKLCEFLDDYDNRADAFINDINAIRNKVLSSKEIIVDYTGSREKLEEIKKYAKDFVASMPKEDYEKKEIHFTPSKSNNAYMTSGQVQYVCRSGDYKAAGLPWNGALFLLRTILSYEYLWINVRVKGGAYGCMNGYTKDGEIYFVSYRDPNLKETNEIFEKSVDHIENYNGSEEEITNYLIGTFSNLDRPLTPALDGLRSLSAYLKGRTNEDAQRERDEVLNADAEVIRSLSKYVKAILSEQRLCVVGSESKVKENSDMFDKTEMLI